MKDAFMIDVIGFKITGRQSLITFKQILSGPGAFPKGLTTSRAFFVGDVNIFGMRLLIQIRYFFVNNRKTILTHWDCIYFTKFS